LGEDRPRIRTSPGVFARLCSFAFNILKANRTDTLTRTATAPASQASQRYLECSLSHSVEQPCLDQLWKSNAVFAGIRRRPALPCR